MNSLTRTETARWLEEHDNFTIVTHRRPDGDTLGSAAALCLGLRSLGKTAHILENPEITRQFAALHRGLTKAAAGKGDTVVAVDVGAMSLLPEIHRELKIDLRIDHHRTSSPFSEWTLVDGDASACGDVIADLLQLLRVRLDKPMAEALYIAVSTDTGGFRYPNTNAHTFRTAAVCVEAGADIASINRELFDTNSLRKMKMQSWIIHNTRFLENGELAVVAIPKAVEQSIGVSEDDMENISGFPRSIEGVNMAATLRQTGEGTVKVSVRAVPGYDAAAVCAQFGGGGHAGAAGAGFELPLEKAAEKIANALLEYYRSR